MNKTIFEELIEGLDLTEEKELKGFSRYLINIEKGLVFDKVTGAYKKNTKNARQYVYHTLRNDDNKSVTLSMASIVMAASLECEIGWWKKMNLVIDHRNENERYNNSILNLQLLTQSENLMKREPVIVKRFTPEELEELHNDFKLIDAALHGQKHMMYEIISRKFGCAYHTVQVKYLEYKKAQ